MHHFIGVKNYLFIRLSFYPIIFLSNYLAAPSAIRSGVAGRSGGAFAPGAGIKLVSQVIQIQHGLAWREHCYLKAKKKAAFKRPQNY